MNNQRIKVIGLLLFMTLTVPATAQEVGLQLYSLRKQFKNDVPGTLNLIHSWGIKAIEGGGTYGLEMDEFRSLLAKNQLYVASVGASYEDLRDNPEKVLHTAAAFGASFVMCAWIPHKGEFGLKELEKATQVFNEAGEYLSKHGVQLTYHAHGYEFRPYQGGTLFDLMAENAEHFAFEMDVYWVQHGGEDPLELLNRYPEKFPLFHLKDMEKGTKKDYSGHADVETNVVLGTGEVDIAGVVKRAKEIGVVQYFFIEDECSRVVKQVPQSLEYLKSLENR